MRIKLLAAAATGFLALAMTTACNDSDQSSSTAGNSGTSSGKGGIGVILPDKKTSARWVNDDPRYLELAFKAAKVPYDIENADGNVANFQAIADKMINNGVGVLMITNLDSDSC